MELEEVLGDLIVVEALFMEEQLHLLRLLYPLVQDGLIHFVQVVLSVVF
jgi:hypothetical protein